MKRMLCSAAAALALLASAPALHAQTVQERDARADLRALVTTPDAVEADRATLEAFLERDEVRAVAERHDVDPDRVKDAVALLDADQTRSMADRVSDIEQELAGGTTITITATTLIIALLILILIIVA